MRCIIEESERLESKQHTLTNACESRCLYDCLLVLRGNIVCSLSKVLQRFERFTHDTTHTQLVCNSALKALHTVFVCLSCSSRVFDVNKNDFGDE